MDRTEIEELYAVEVALLKRLQKFGKEYPQDNIERVEKVVILLLYRIFSNLYSALLLTMFSLKRGKISFFQLPIGIILRCAFTDCLFALYIQRAGIERSLEELDLKTIEYANSLLERKEVYRDQVKSIVAGFDDSLIDHIWEMTLEDNFLPLLTFDEKKAGWELTKQSSGQLHEAGFVNSKSLGIKEQKDFLVKQNGLEAVVTRLYHYYRYFSQYEHFSENGQGDVLASSREDGNDNIHFPSAIRALSAGVECVMKSMSSIKRE